MWVNTSEKEEHDEEESYSIKNVIIGDSARDYHAYVYFSVYVYRALAR